MAASLGWPPAMRHAPLPHAPLPHAPLPPTPVRYEARRLCLPSAGARMDITAADVARFRAETPGCSSRAHFNNAGAALPPRSVTERVIAHLRREAEIGGYEAAAEAAEERRAVYVAAAALLGADPDEIALTDSATRAYDTALWSVPLAAGDRVLLSQVAYGSNALALLELRRRTGIQLVVVRSDADGRIDLDALEAALGEGAALVSLTHVPTNSGLVSPAAEVGAACRRHGVPFLLDACQSAGQLHLDVDALGCDLLSATSRKYLRGPRGQGLLYVRRSLLPRLNPPMPDVGSAEWVGAERWEPVAGARRFECWEHDVAGRLGFGQALRLATTIGTRAIERRVRTLAADLRQQLAALPGVTLRDPGPAPCGIVTFTVDGRAPEAVKASLGHQGVNVSVSHAGSTLLDMRARGLDAVVRASVHYYNDDTDIQRLVDGLRAGT